jgi:hypothetical protein
VRTYVPTTLGALEEAFARGTVPAGDWFVADDASEDAEYAALMAAADDSAGLLGADDPPRRVVLAVDVDSVWERDDSSLVEVGSAFPFSLVRAVHADTEDLRGAAYDPDEQGDLGWYALQEIPDLLA